MKTNDYLFTRTLTLAALLGAASTLPNSAVASSSAIYPVLPDLPGADIRGEARVVIHLDENGSLVEVDGMLYALDGRPLEIGFDDLDSITLLFVAPTGASVFVSEDGLWTDVLEPSLTSRLLAFDLLDDAYQALSPAGSEPEEFGFEIALPGQPAPTVPDVVIRPTEDDPDPS